MLFSGNGNGDPRRFMYYNGKTYINGTKFTVKDEYISAQAKQGKNIWKYAEFWGTTNGPDGLIYYFSRYKCLNDDLLSMGYKPGTEEYIKCRRDYAATFMVRPYELNRVVEEITFPITITEQEEEARRQAIMEMIEHPKKDWDYPDLIVGWIIYIGVLIGSLIFNQFYIIWIVATFVFHTYRKRIVE